jgi:hypothetical protein
MKSVFFILASCLPREPEQWSAIAIAWLAWHLYNYSSFTFHANGKGRYVYNRNVPLYSSQSMLLLQAHRESLNAGKRCWIAGLSKRKGLVDSTRRQLPFTTQSLTWPSEVVFKTPPPLALLSKSWNGKLQHRLGQTQKNVHKNVHTRTSVTVHATAVGSGRQARFSAHVAHGHDK